MCGWVGPKPEPVSKGMTFGEILRKRGQSPTPKGNLP